MDFGVYLLSSNSGQNQCFMQWAIKLFVDATARILIVKLLMYSLDWLSSGNDVMSKTCEM
jgi:hypothetical protein